MWMGEKVSDDEGKIFFDCSDDYVSIYICENLFCKLKNETFSSLLDT